MELTEAEKKISDTVDKYTDAQLSKQLSVKEKILGIICIGLFACLTWFNKSYLGGLTILAVIIGISNEYKFKAAFSLIKKLKKELQSKNG